MWWVLSVWLLVTPVGEQTATPQQQVAMQVPAVSIGTFEGNDPLLASQVRNTLLNLFAGSTALQVVDRTALRQVLEELKFQQLGLVPLEAQVPLGEFRAASLLLAGSIEVDGSRFVLSAHWVDVRSGTVLPHSAERVEGERSNWEWHTRRLAERLHRRLTGASLVPGMADESLPEEGVPPKTVKRDYEESVYRWHIEFVTERQLMRSYPDGTFRPNEPVSQRYFASVLSRLQNQVGSSAAFQPEESDQPVTRMQAVLAMDRLMIKSRIGAQRGYYLEVPGWAKGIVGWDATRSAPLTREVLAALLCNLLKSLELSEQNQVTVSGSEVQKP